MKLLGGDKYASEVSECIEAREKRITRRGRHGRLKKRRFGGKEVCGGFEDTEERRHSLTSPAFSGLHIINFYTVEMHDS